MAFAIAFFIPVIGWVIGLCIVIYTLGDRVVGEKRLAGECPYCGTVNGVSVDRAGFNCVACARRVIVREDTFLPI